MKKRVKVICCLLFICFSLQRCVLKTQWSVNFALVNYSTQASHPFLNDGKLETIASVEPKKGKRVFTLTFPEIRPVRKIIIHNANLFGFDVDYWDAEAEAWKTIRQVRKKRHIGTSRTQRQYVISQLNLQTNQIRVNVLRTIDETVTSREYYKSVDLDKEKVLGKIRVRNNLGHYIEMNRILQLAEAQIREIEVYNLQPSESFTVVQVPKVSVHREIASPKKEQKVISMTPQSVELGGVRKAVGIENLAPGVEVRISTPRSRKNFVVYVPFGYTPSRPWPVIFSLPRHRWQKSQSGLSILLHTGRGSSSLG